MVSLPYWGMGHRQSQAAVVTVTGTGTSGFGSLLRMRRGQRGLSQLELAARAGTTSRHLSFLETGRSRPRAEMVLRLGRALDLMPREQNALLEAAGLRAVFPNRPLQDAEMAPFRGAVDMLLERHEPWPAAVLDRYGAVQRANAGFERLTPGLVGLEPEELVDRFFAAGPWRDMLVNWPEVAAAWLARWQPEARRTGDTRLAALVRRAERLAGPLPQMPVSGEAPVVCSRLRWGGEVLEFFSVVVRFDTTLDVTLSELRVELLYPANGEANRHFSGANKRHQVTETHS
jgi:transcriptional regulator with XRE-family HTH domain